MLLLVIKLIVKNQNGFEVRVTYKRLSPLVRLMNAYCARSGDAFESCRFLFDGQRLKPDHTPDQVSHIYLLT
jgi:small ubiquitin-related modifier